jgi:uncharacterized membrane protein
LVLATLIGFVVLRPTRLPNLSRAVELPTDLFDATVIGFVQAACPGVDDPTQSCPRVEAELTSGPNKGKVVSFDAPDESSAYAVKKGEKVVLSYVNQGPPEIRYNFADRQRKRPMLLLGLIFAGVVTALGRWRGFAALLGFVISLFILVAFVLPAILAGRNPLAVSVVGSAAVMFIALYLAHGINEQTTTAVLGTLASLAITGLLALIFVKLTRLTGLASEEAITVNVASGKINLEGMLLGGIIIGSLGVLDDVTITQAAAVWELHMANATMKARDLYAAAIRIGRDHIASTVNTLVLCYAGASLPLLILFTISGSRLADVLNGEVVAEEVVRTLVGSIGLVSSVPITTALAVLVVKGTGARNEGGSPQGRREAPRRGGRRQAVPSRGPGRHASGRRGPSRQGAGRHGLGRQGAGDGDEFWGRKG